jgi:hypothetical protein
VDESIVDYTPPGVNISSSGLRVGRRTTPNKTDDALEAIKQLRGNQYAGAGIGSPYQLTSCPWCGSTIEPGKHLDCKPFPNESGRTLTFGEPRGGDGPKRGTTVSLLHHPGLERWEEFTCLNSLREVEPSVKLIMDDGGLDEENADQGGQP